MNARKERPGDSDAENREVDDFHLVVLFGTQGFYRNCGEGVVKWLVFYPY